MKLPKFDKAKVKEFAVLVGIAAAFFMIPVTYHISKERALIRVLNDNGCQSVGAPQKGQFPLEPLIKEGYVCPSTVLGSEFLGSPATIVPIYK